MSYFMFEPTQELSELWPVKFSKRNNKVYGHTTSSTSFSHKVKNSHSIKQSRYLQKHFIRDIFQIKIWTQTKDNAILKAFPQ